ncbi:MAG TPA: AsmA family protein [bacterium]|jgi:uncharacterized protein involved in outer membrane biogenesis|nr:AsmA family protein [bacterium]
MSAAVAGSWYRSRWAVVAGAGVLVIALIALAAPYLFSVDRFRPLIDSFLERSTGHQVEIESLRLHLFPTVRVQAANVQVKNPQGFPAGDAVVIAAIDLGVAPRALLSRRLEITSVSLSGVKVNVLHNASGRSNLGAAASSGSSPAPAPAGSSGFSLGRIGTVTVADAEITLGPALRVTGLHGTMNAVDLRAPDWTTQLVITSNLKGVTVTAAQLGAPLQLSAGDLRVKSTGASARFSASLQGVRADGTLLVSNYNPLTVRFALTVPQLNVDALSRIMTGSGGAAPARGQARPGPKRLLASGTVKIARLIARPLTLSRVNGALRVYTTAVEISSYSLAGYGGSASGSAVINHAAAGIPATMTAQIRGVNLSQLLGAFGSGAGRITGSLQASMRLSAALGRDLKRTLSGSGSFFVGNGTFPGMEMQVTLAKLAKAFQVDVAGGTTKFRRFSGNLRIGGGRVFGSNLTLDAVGFASTAQGSFGLDGTLDFRGTGHLVRRAAATSPQSGTILQRIGRGITGTVARGLQGVNVPFTLRGTMADPQFTLAGDVKVTEQPIRRTEPRESPADGD